MTVSPTAAPQVVLKGVASAAECTTALDMMWTEMEQAGSISRADPSTWADEGTFGNVGASRFLLLALHTVLAAVNAAVPAAVLAAVLAAVRAVPLCPGPPLGSICLDKGRGRERRARAGATPAQAGPYQDNLEGTRAGWADSPGLRWRLQNWGHSDFLWYVRGLPAVKEVWVSRWHSLAVRVETPTIIDGEGVVSEKCLRKLSLLLVWPPGKHAWSRGWLTLHVWLWVRKPPAAPRSSWCPSTAPACTGRGASNRAGASRPSARLPSCRALLYTFRRRLNRDGEGVSAKLTASPTTVRRQPAMGFHTDRRNHAGVPDGYIQGNSRRQDSYSAAPSSPFSRWFNVDGEGVPVE